MKKQEGTIRTDQSVPMALNPAERCGLHIQVPHISRKNKSAVATCNREGGSVYAVHGVQTVSLQGAPATKQSLEFIEHASLARNDPAALFIASNKPRLRSVLSMEAIAGKYNKSHCERSAAIPKFERT